MAVFDRRSATSLLEDVLDRERAALLAGDHARLAALLPEKTRATARAARALDGQTDRAALVRLLAKTARNQRLLAAAGEGIRNATDRLQSLRAPARPLETYGPDGHRLSIGKHSLTMEKKA